MSLSAAMAPPTCPVVAMTAYVSLRQDHPGAFFTSRRATPVTKGGFVQYLRHILVSIGLPQDQHAGHSFRIGAVLAGIEDSTIQALGRWQSSAFLQYIRMPRSTWGWVGINPWTVTTPLPLVTVSGRGSAHTPPPQTVGRSSSHDIHLSWGPHTGTGNPYAIHNG